MKIYDEIISMKDQIEKELDKSSEMLNNLKENEIGYDEQKQFQHVLMGQLSALSWVVGKTNEKY